MLDTVLNIIGSAAGGSLIGLIGTFIKGRDERKERDAQRAHDLALRDLDREEMQLEAELAMKRTEAEIAGKLKTLDMEGQISRDIEASKLQAVSYESDQASYSKGATKMLRGFFGGLAAFMLVCVDVFRGVMRPGITSYLLVIESLIAWQLYLLLNSFTALDSAEALILFTTIINSIVFLTSTSVTWWFGSRPNR
jgi:Flp pilus assembly protein TadB